MGVGCRWVGLRMHACCGACCGENKLEADCPLLPSLPRLNLGVLG